MARAPPGSSCPVPAARVPHHTIFDGFWAGVATPVSERFPESLENGGFCDSLSAIPRNEKAHIPLCGTTKATQCIFPMFFPWCGHPGTASLARQSAAKSGRFSPDGKTGHGTSGAADERHPGPPQAASPANSPSTRFTAQPASEGTIAHHSIQCSATAPVSSSTFAVDDTPSVWISREPSTTCSAPLARGWPCMRSWNHEHLHYLQRRVPDMGERDGVDRRRQLPLPHRCRVQPGAHRLPATADLQRAGTVQNRDGRRQEPGLDRQCGDTVRTSIGPRYEVGGIHDRVRQTGQLAWSGGSS